MGLLLYFIAWGIQPILAIVNYFLVIHKKGYFRLSALNFDKYANCEYRTLWNELLITSNSPHLFGNPNESISEVLGHNLIANSLSPSGKLLVKILTKKHCIDATKH